MYAVVPVAVDHQARRGGGDCGGDLGPAGLVDLAVRETGQRVEPGRPRRPVVADQHVEWARSEAGDVGRGGGLLVPVVEALGAPAAVDAVGAAQRPEPCTVPGPAVPAGRPPQVILDRHEPLVAVRAAALGEAADEHLVVVVAVDEHHPHPGAGGQGGDVAGEGAPRGPVPRLGRVVAEPEEPEPEVADLDHPPAARRGGAGDHLGRPVLVAVPVAGEQQSHGPIRSRQP